MLQWTTQPQNTSWHSSASAESNSSIEAQQINLHSPSYQAFIGQIPSLICPRFGSEEETAEHLLFCSKWATEWHKYFSDCINISYVFRVGNNLLEFLFQVGNNLLEFLIPLGHLPPPPYRQLATPPTATTTVCS